MFIQAITTVVVACGAIIPGCQQTAPPPLPVCTVEHGGMLADGTIVVTIDHRAAMPCNGDGTQRLDLVWNQASEGEGWGGDASVARAEQQALDAGCDPQWHNDGGEFWLLGFDCDY